MRRGRSSISGADWIYERRASTTSSTIELRRLAAAHERAVILSYKYIKPLSSFLSARGYVVRPNELTSKRVMAPIHDFADRGDVAGVRRELAAGVSPDDNDSFLTDTPLHKASRFTAPAHVQIMSLLIENGANPNSRNYLGWSPLHLCVAGGNIDGAALILAAGASPSLKCDDGRAPLEYNPGSKRILPLLLKFGAPLPRSSHAGWMNQPLLYRERPDPKMKRYIAKVTVAGSWVEYEKGHTRRLVPVFEKIFPRPRLPHEIASHVVRFCFHTGDY